MIGQRNLPAESAAIHVGLFASLVCGALAAIAAVLRAWASRRSR